MRIKCNVDIVNRVLPSMSIKTSGKAAHTQLSIGKKPGSKDNTLFLLMCTAKDRNGTKYLLAGNVEKVFGRFISEGKATLRFKDPPQDVCISKADPLELKNFVSLLQLANHGKCPDNITLSTLQPAKAKNVEKPKTRLQITCRKDYPLTTNFPSTLEYLKVTTCNLKRVDSRILSLKRLQILDMSENVLENVPEDFSKMTVLREINFAQNCFSVIPKTFCYQPNLQQNLAYLDLSGNKISFLPIQICELVSLVTLKIDNNILESLPPTIGRLQRLRFLSASGNRIGCLPASISHLQLETIDLHGNSFISDVSNNLPDTFPEITLVECCARAIRKKRLQYSEDSLHTHLCRYLDSARICWCGNYCFECCVQFMSNFSLNKLAATVLAVDCSGRTSVPLQSFLCSPQCLRRYQKNPHAYWKR